jgi:hypothetical protein
MKVTARESDGSIVVSVGDLHATRPISDIVVKLEGSRIRVWVVNRMTHSWSLCAETTILNSTAEMNGPSGQSMEPIPLD